MLEPWFAQPGYLWTLAVVPAAVAFMIYAWFRRRRAFATGNGLLVRKGILLKPLVRLWKRSGC